MNHAWMDFIWKQGDNLSLLTPKPIHIEGGERTLRVPYFLREPIQPGNKEDSDEEETLHVVEPHNNMEKGLSWLLEKTGDLVKGTVAAVEDQQQKSWQIIHKKRDDSVAQELLEEATDAGKSRQKEGTTQADAATSKGGSTRASMVG
jgi:hypothetical protein